VRQFQRQPPEVAEITERNPNVLGSVASMFPVVHVKLKQHASAPLRDTHVVKDLR
jgi:hypothetical protein